MLVELAQYYKDNSAINIVKLLAKLIAANKEKI
jgi:hypothetical protein